METIGPYRLLEPLGRGGMGVVYRAQHLKSGVVAALKTVQVLRQGLLQCLRREIHVLARLHHPGMVPILDEGLHEGIPWYAMELVEGKTLRQHCAELMAAAVPESLLSCSTADVLVEPAAHTGLLAAPAAVVPGGSGPPRLRAKLRLPAAGGALPRVLTLMRHLCAPLAFLHGEGVVHRDLKPENVLVRPDGRPVLLDFGLMATFGGPANREALEHQEAAGGTLAYMAPEQCRGDLVDARADLYSLGCMLYELVSGRRPFQGATPVQLVYQHLEVAPVPPSELVEGVPPQLEGLILRLLAKDPRDRLGHAGAVALALGELGAEDGLYGASPKPRAYLYRPGFAGRAGVLAKLREELRHMEAGTGGVVLLSGESGVGKTRLAMEAVRETRLRGVHVLTSECFSAGMPGPLQALRPALRQLADHCREGGCAETDRVLGRRGKLLAVYEPALAGLPGQEAYPEPAELSAEAARLRLMSYLVQSFEALAAEKPVLLILDDLQWADALTLSFLELLMQSRGLERLRLLLMGIYRTEEASEELRKLRGASGAWHLELERLDEEDVGTMTGDILALEVPPAQLVRFLTQQSDGNPFFVAEYLRTALAEGLLYRDEIGRWQVEAQNLAPLPGQAVRYEDLPLPGSLRELVGRRFDGLSAVAVELLDAAAVLGREMDEALLLEIARLDGAEELEATAVLLERQVLAQGEDGELRFVHEQIREVAYERIAEARRQSLHRAVAEALEKRTAAEPAGLGHHWEQAGELAKARPYHLAAAKDAQRRYAFVEAAQLYRAYLRLVQSPTLESITARNDLGYSVLGPQGRTAEAIEQYEQALLESRQLGDRSAESASLGSLGRACYETGRPREARDFLEQALRLDRELGDRKGEVYTLSGMSLLLQEQGRIEEARALWRRCLEIDRELGDRGLEAAALTNLGVLDLEQGRFEAARSLYEQALTIHRELRNRPWEGYVLHNLGLIDAQQGDLEGACLRIEQALVIGREIGNRRFEAFALNSLANSRQVQGRLEETRSLYEQALAIHREVRNRKSEGITLQSKARLERHAGALGEAIRHLDQAEATLKELGAALYVAFCICERGHLALLQGSSATDLLDQARVLADKLQAGIESELGQAVTRLQRSQQAFEAGQHHRLFRGELLEDLPEGLRHWLAETGQMPVSTEIRASD